MSDRFIHDELPRAFQLDRLEAVLFDMDGTLIASEYDWPAIRQRLGVTRPPILEELSRLPEPQRSQRLAELEAIEREATRQAGLAEGAHELLDLLAERAIPTALVTNNTDENTAFLLGRFDLDFAVVITRDLGPRKPSPAPVNEAIARLGVAPQRTLAVGDSPLDITSARAAGCGAICVVGHRAEEHQDEVDLVFADLGALTRYLKLAL